MRALFDDTAGVLSDAAIAGFVQKEMNGCTEVAAAHAQVLEWQRQEFMKSKRKEKKRRRRDGGPEASGLSGPTEISGETTRMS